MKFNCDLCSSSDSDTLYVGKINSVCKSFLEDSGLTDLVCVKATKI